MKRLIFLFVVVTVSFASRSYADLAKSQLFDELDGRFDMSQYLAENAFGFLPVPIIITDPAVDGGLGVVGVFFQESDEQAEQRRKAMKDPNSNAGRYLLPPNVSMIAAAGTGNGSWMAGGGHLAFINEGRIRYRALAGYMDLFLPYYGTGDVTLEKPIELNTQAYGVFQRLTFKLADSPIFAGVVQRYIGADISPKNLGDLDSRLPLEWADTLRDVLTRDVATSGLGFSVELDTRDNFFSPSLGYQYSLDYLWFRDAFGSDIDYTLTSFSGLNYWHLNKRFDLGLRIASEYADSDAFLPPYATPSVDLRGIPSGRYMGKLTGTLETEFTWHIDSRWKLKLFTGAARASNSTHEFDDAETQDTYGVGTRYLVARRYGFDMGIDLARGPEETVWYITAGSAW